jgi:hypothetical protein
MKYGIIAVFILTVLSCTDDKVDMVNSKDLRGEWTEINTKTDTLSFEILNGKEYMMLNRAVLTQTGPYEYKLLPNDEISIHWTLAGTFNSFNDYYFKLSGDKLSIGNFYDSPAGTILTFQKLK